jgi:hypothetical protein
MDPLGNIWKMFNERKCLTSGYTIYNSSLYSDMRFYHKDEKTLGVVNKLYFKGNICEWLKKDIWEDITPNCNFFYLYKVDDSVERINDIFKIFKGHCAAGNNSQNFAFIECPNCMELAAIGLQLPEKMNALKLNNTHCIFCVGAEQKPISFN